MTKKWEKKKLSYDCSHQKCHSLIQDFESSRSIFSMWKFLLIHVLFCPMSVICYSAKVTKELSEPRTMDYFKFLYNVLQNINPFQKSPNQKTSKLDELPYNGIYYDGNSLSQRVHTIDKFPTLEEWNKEEGMMHMPSMTAMTTHHEDMHKEEEEKEEEPSFWVFDKHSDKNFLLKTGKVLLKLIVLKKIIKFIALIGLLFFIPTLRDNTETESTTKDSRNLDADDRIDYRTKEILFFASQAIEGFTIDKTFWCVGAQEIYCRFQLMFDNVDQSYPVDQIINMWYPQSAARIRSFLSKLALPKYKTTTPETYLQIPEDQNEVDQTEADEKQDESNEDAGSGFQRNSLESDDDNDDEEQDLKKIQKLKRNHPESERSMLLASVTVDEVLLSDAKLIFSFSVKINQSIKTMNKHWHSCGFKNKMKAKD
ncbi:CLUMA_CG015584, isoform A [Clunio marinus]|uniref:CLUMA_CG015584, isoform A n=1 Tax=Clunio marinus TaxID=568069 RepID=A0A1J1INZ7_9DIPT|nr:CLUMA_CG015584, isoform A [Clunio marinus]